MTALLNEMPAELTTQIWSSEDIAQYLGCSVPAAMRHARHPKFPKPIGNYGRNRKWYSDEVVRFFRTSSREQVAEIIPFTPLPLSKNHTTYIPKRSPKNG